ncbi:MAG: indole-3-glycerol phosphate synthase TrpC [Caulobacterales bacterium]|nr:indole-3-glycerol phosphate synthase TrpC [Caulobacterales bacterium]
MTNALTRILAYKREEVAARKAAAPPAEVEAMAAAQPPPRGFRAALAQQAETGRPGLIAEIKKASPSKGLIAPDFDPPAIARAYADGGATCLSVLTDAPSFQGSEEHLKAARAAVPLPALRKDFTVDPYQVAEARAIGADAVLVILAAVDDVLAADLLAAARALAMDVLVEVHDEDEMARAAALGGDLVGVNNRDLRSFETRLETTERLAPLAPPGALLVAESGIGGAEDVARLARAGAGAFLVGESLMRAGDPAAAVRSLMGTAAST